MNFHTTLSYSHTCNELAVRRIDRDVLIATNCSVTHQLQYRLDVCMDLLTSHRSYEWLRNLITGDEKWVLYVNHTRKRQWLSVGQTGTVTPKNDLHPKQVMLSVWWGVKGIIHWELLPDGCTVTADLYCQQLDRVAQKLKSKQDRVYFFR